MIGLDARDEADDDVNGMWAGFGEGVGVDEAAAI
jgi:hypothetical protein